MKVRLTRSMTKEELTVALALGAKDEVDFVFCCRPAGSVHRLERRKADPSIDVDDHKYCWLFEPIAEEKPIG